MLKAHELKLVQKLQVRVLPRLRPRPAPCVPRPGPPRPAPVPAQPPSRPCRSSHPPPPSLPSAAQWRMHPCYHTPYTALADLGLALGHSTDDFDLHLRTPAESFVDASYREVAAPLRPNLAPPRPSALATFRTLHPRTPRTNHTLPPPGAPPAIPPPKSPPLWRAQAETCMTFPPLVAASAAILATCTLLHRTTFLPLIKMYLPLLSGFCGAREVSLPSHTRRTTRALLAARSSQQPTIYPQRPRNVRALLRPDPPPAHKHTRQHTRRRRRRRSSGATR